MAVYLVTYDLNRETVRPNIVGEIKKFTWARLSESSYAIETHLTVEAVYNRLKPVIDSNDNIYIISLKHPYQGFGPADVNKWLEDRLTY